MKTRSDKNTPNILWICTDQQRADSLGCYGNKFARTPVLDALAAESAIFMNAFSQSPVCTPSRVSFLTGRYPVTAKGRQNGADIPGNEILVTKLLRDAGYTCGLSGKLHLSACHPDSGCTEMEPRIDDGYKEFHWSHDPSHHWGTHNEYHTWLKDEKHTTFNVTPRSDCRWVQNGMPEALHQSTWCAQKAIDFIEAPERKDTPWLFSVNIFDPHHPFDPPADLMESYMDVIEDIPLPAYQPGELENKPVWQRQDHAGAYNQHAGFPYDEMTDQDHRLIRAAYLAMCELVDKQVGRMLNALERTGQRDNTIIIFMSDHGELLGDHGIYLKGPFFYDCSIRVPLIINWRNIIPARCYQALIGLMDLPQTILDLCDIPYHLGMQGKSIMHLFQPGSPDNHQEHVYCEYLNAMPWHTTPKAFASMVRNDRYKLVIAHGAGGGELYDLLRDPLEYDNLYDSKEMETVKILLLESLLFHWSRTADPIPRRKSDW